MKETMARYKKHFDEVLVGLAALPISDDICEDVRMGFWREAGKELCQTGKCWMSEESKKKLEQDLEEIRSRGKKA